MIFSESHPENSGLCSTAFGSSRLSVAPRSRRGCRKNARCRIISLSRNAFLLAAWLKDIESLNLKTLWPWQKNTARILDQPTNMISSCRWRWAGKVFFSRLAVVNWTEIRLEVGGSPPQIHCHLDGETDDVWDLTISMVSNGIEL